MTSICVVVGSPDAICRSKIVAESFDDWQLRDILNVSQDWIIGEHGNDFIIISPPSIVCSPPTGLQFKMTSARVMGRSLNADIKDLCHRG